MVILQMVNAPITEPAVWRNFLVKERSYTTKIAHNKHGCHVYFTTQQTSQQTWLSCLLLT